MLKEPIEVYSPTEKTWLNLQYVYENLINISELHICISNPPEITLLESVITRNTTTLTSIHLDGALIENKVIDKELASRLVAAISKCLELSILKIENFALAFRNEGAQLPLLFRNLPFLEHLSFKNTYITNHASIFNHLSDHSKIKILDLTNTALYGDRDFGNTIIELGANSSLQVLILDDNPMTPNGMSKLLEGVLSVNNRLRVLQWRPHTYETNQRLVMAVIGTMMLQDPVLSSLGLHELEQLFYQRINYPEKPPATHYDQVLDYLYYVLGSYKVSSAQFDDARQKLKDIQAVCQQRYHPAELSELTISIGPSNRFLECVAGQILIHARTLKKLTLTVTARNYALLIDKVKIAHLQKALATCRQLETFELHNFTNNFTFQGMAEIITTLTQLPNLIHLSLTKTYLGKAGVNALVAFLQRNQLQYLNLYFSGLIDTDDYTTLAKGLARTSSLRVLDLGQNPMVPAWLKPVVAVLRDKTSSCPKIVWRCSPTDVMEINYIKMQEDLLRYPPTYFLPDQQPELEKAERYFDKHNNHPKTKQHFQFFSTKDEQHGAMELNTLPAETDALRREVKSYGSV